MNPHSFTLYVLGCIFPIFLLIFLPALGANYGTLFTVVILLILVVAVLAINEHNKATLDGKWRTIPKTRKFP